MKYVISSGHLYDDSGKLIGVGYSGHGLGLNNPRLVNVRATGPLPPGLYTIGDPKDPPDHLGPIAMPLEPDSHNEMYDRSDFFIHGDNAQLNHSASDGCIIMPHNVRQLISDGDDNKLTVVPE